jgi:hypothetical protein
MIVTFDIGNGDFDYYTNEEWESQLTAWREELEADDYEGSEALDAEELVEMMYGDELFFQEVPQIVLDRMPR